MPPSRLQRQRARRAAASRGSSKPIRHSPRMDAFGDVKIGLAEYRARAMEYAPGKIALFRDIDPTTPILLELSSELTLKGRLARATFFADGEEREFLFKKAGCGCETPRNLKGGRNALMTGAGLTDGSETQPAPETKEVTV